MSVQPDPAHQVPQVLPPRTQVKGSVYAQPQARPAQDVAERAREHLRSSRSAERRPLFPDTRRGWALLLGLLLVPILTATLLLTGRSSAAAVAALSPSPGSLTAAFASGATAGAGASDSASASDPNADPSGSSQATPSPSPELSHDPIIPPSTLTGYVWPLSAPMITLPFGPSPWGDFFYQDVRIHDGVDMASWCGDTVMAAHDGTVIATGTSFDPKIGWVESLQPYTDLFNRKHWWSSLPLTVVIDDGDGFISMYAHEYQITVKVGQKVKAGQRIGYEGATGNASGCHVHFGLFNPTETAWFALDPGIVSRDLLPAHEIARVNPLYVLSFRCEFEEMRVLFPEKAASCPPLPTPTAK